MKSTFEAVQISRASPIWQSYTEHVSNIVSGGLQKSILKSLHSMLRRIEAPSDVQVSKDSRSTYPSLYLHCCILDACVVAFFIPTLLYSSYLYCCILHTCVVVFLMPVLLYSSYLYCCIFHTCIFVLFIPVLLYFSRLCCCILHTCIVLLTFFYP